MSTSYTDVMIERSTGRRTFFHFQGANGRLRPERFDFAGATARIFHVGAPGVHERMDADGPYGNGFAEVLARARAAGLRTNLELVCVEPERIRPWQALASSISTPSSSTSWRPPRPPAVTTQWKRPVS